MRTDDFGVFGVLAVGAVLVIAHGTGQALATAFSRMSGPDLGAIVIGAVATIPLATVVAVALLRRSRTAVPVGPN